MNFVFRPNPWFYRGGFSDYINRAGGFAYSRTTGGAAITNSFRVVLTAEDN